MALERIQELRGRHAGETAWIFGKGPSLDKFDFGRAGPLRICINESLIRVPSPAYFFSHDETPIGHVASTFPRGCMAILEPSRAEYAAKLGLSRDQIRTYQKAELSAGEQTEYPIAHRSSDTLIGLTGTVHSAIDFCRHIGVARIILVGFDGAGDYAPSLKLEMPVGGGRHAQIRRDSKRLLETLRIPFQFTEANDAMSTGDTDFDYAALYDKLRREGYHDEEDGASHLDPHLPWIFEHLQFHSVLDIGCSAGKSLDRFSQRGFETTGVDISSIAVQKAVLAGRNVVQASATSLPFDDGAFDLVCSADVFEHLDEKDAPIACHEAIRVSRKYVFMKIAEKEDATKKWKEIAGHSLHLTTRPISWWQEFFRPYGEMLKTGTELFCFEKSR